MTESESITPCKPLFQTLEILTLPSQYILFLMTLLAKSWNVKPSVLHFTIKVEEADNGFIGQWPT